MYHPFRLTVLIVLGVAFALFLITSDDTAYADTPFHSLQISLFPAELTAKLTETELGAVTFGGNVTVEKPQAIAEVTVSLTAECGRGWPAVHSPQTMKFINPGTQRFQVTGINSAWSSLVQGEHNLAVGAAGFTTVTIFLVVCRLM